jgi:hypothetical protein
LVVRSGSAVDVGVVDVSLPDALNTPTEDLVPRLPLHILAFTSKSFALSRNIDSKRLSCIVRYVVSIFRPIHLGDGS